MPGQPCYTQCLLFVTQRAGESNTRKLRNCSQRSKRSTGVPAKGFALFPEIYKKKHPEVVEAFKQNDVHILNYQNVSLLTGNDKLEVIELLLFENPASKSLAIVTSSINKQILHLFLPDITICLQKTCGGNVRPAVDVKNFNIVKQIFTPGRDIHFRSDIGESLLHLAAKSGPKSLVSLILELEEDINVRRRDGATALHIATENSLTQVVRMLLKRGADVRSEYKEGLTPLHCAVFNDSVLLIQLLLDHGADIEAQAMGGVTPLTLAAIEDSGTIFQFLLKHGADIQARNEKGITALHRYAAKGFLSTVELLLRNGAMVDDRNNNGHTALHLAAFAGRLDVVQTLLLNNADVNLKAKNGRTPIFYAAQQGHIEVIDLCLKFGALGGIKDEEDLSVLQHAFHYRKPTLFLHLLESCFLDAKSLEETGIIDFHRHVLDSMNEDESSHVFDQDLLDNLTVMLASHIVKIVALNLRKDGEEIDASPMWTESFLTTLDNFKTRCKKEVARMKKQTVGDTNVSFCDLLTKDSAKVVCLLRNKSVDKITDSELQKKFPTYGSILAHHFRKGREQKNMVMEAIKICNSLFGHFKKLPCEIKERIIAHFSFKDLLSLKKACERPSSSSEGCSCEAGSA